MHKEKQSYAKNWTQLSPSNHSPFVCVQVLEKGLKCFLIIQGYGILNNYKIISRNKFSQNGRNTTTKNSWIDVAIFWKKYAIHCFGFFLNIWLAYLSDARIFFWIHAKSNLKTKCPNEMFHEQIVNLIIWFFQTWHFHSFPCIERGFRSLVYRNTHVFVIQCARVLDNITFLVCVFLLYFVYFKT